MPVVAQWQFHRTSFVVAFHNGHACCSSKQAGRLPFGEVQWKHQKSWGSGCSEHLECFGSLPPRGNSSVSVLSIVGCQNASNRGVFLVAFAIIHRWDACGPPRAIQTPPACFVLWLVLAQHANNATTIAGMVSVRCKPETQPQAANHTQPCFATGTRGSRVLQRAKTCNPCNCTAPSSPSVP